MFAKRSNPFLYLKEGLRHLAIKCKSIIQIKIPWGCSCAISKVSSIDDHVRIRWIIRLRDTVPEQYRVTKVGQHRIESIRVLRTGMWTFIGFDCFACGFRFWSNFFFFFAVLRLWMIFFDGFEVCNRTLSSFRTVEFHTDSCFANWKSLFLKLQIFPFVLFRVLN